MATIGEMAAGVAHELNQPLTAIANYAHACERLLSRPQTNPADVRDALRQISVQTTRAADILRRLRALARSQRAEHAPASLNALVTELRELLQTDAVVHGVQLTLELASDLPEVRVDSGQIQQVILNLARNSLDALAGRNRSGGQITIRTALTAEGEVQLSVCDNGPGVSAEAMQRIFDPFFSTKENGTGLGLAITHSIVRAHGGLLAHRRNVPNGACFDILLPAQPR
jgi:two-component system, LuxR family, sensor kinase FixL